MEHGHSATSELPVTTITVTGTTDASGNHTHTFPANHGWDGTANVGCSSGYDAELYKTTSTSGAHTHTFTGKGTIGGGDSHNNLPPYTVIYRWRRTA